MTGLEAKTSHSQLAWRASYFHDFVYLKQINKAGTGYQIGKIGTVVFHRSGNRLRESFGTTWKYNLRLCDRHGHFPYLHTYTFIFYLLDLPRSTTELLVSIYPFWFPELFEKLMQNRFKYSEQIAHIFLRVNLHLSK